MNDVERQSGTRNATILMVFVGALHIYNGYFLLQVLVPDQWPDQTTFGTVTIVFGLLTFCASLIVWQQKSWATKIIAGIGIAVCGTLIISGFYLMGVILAPIYYIAIHQLRRVDVYSDWHED